MARPWTSPPRLDRLTLGSANDTDEPFTNPRADHVAPLAKDTWTFGGNWQVHRWVRVQGNLIREQLVDSLGVRDIDTEPRVDGGHALPVRAVTGITACSDLCFDASSSA